VSWPARDIFAISVDGKVLINARAFETEDLAKLAHQKGVFIGVPISERDVRVLLEHVYDACSEVAAEISSRRRRRRGKK
jgi:hypothetical protein